MTSRQFCRLVLVAQCLTALFLILPVPTVHATEGHVYLSEIAWAGSSLSTADEWLELANPTDQTVDMTAWRLIGAGASDKPLVLPAGALIPPGGVYLIANYAETDAHSSLAISPNCVSTTVSLPNDKLLIRLFDADGRQVDQAGDGQAPPAGYSSGLKATMARTDYLMDGYLTDAWKTAEKALNLKTQDLGTPGYTDIIPSSAEADETSASTEISVPDVSTTTASSTLPMPDIAASTTSTTASSTPAVTTTSTAQIPSTQDATTTEQSMTMVTPSTPNPSPARSDVQLLRLNEIMPNPAEGSEWAEILSAAPDRTISLNGVELHDKSGRIAVLSGTVSSTQPFFVYTLHSARFNNNGDSIYLIANGQVVDTLTYGGSHKGYSWAVDEHGAWQETATPTPGAANLITLLAAEANDSDAEAEAKVAALVNATTEATAQALTPAASTTTKATTLTPAKAVSTIAKTVTRKTAVSTTAKTVTTKATTAKKTTITTKVKPIINLDFDMLQDDEYGGMRVRLQGMVSTPPRLLSGRAFILTNPEGRGLLVKLSADKKLPTIGTQMAIIGTLKFDTHELPYLFVSKADTLSMLPTSVSSTPRDVAWLAPAAEDAWSLVTASGTVQGVSGATINLLVDDIEVNVKIKPGVAYRASRLKKGDTISVSGVLDISGEIPAILPRSADEIRLVSLAPEKVLATTTTTPNGLPGWTPFGVALGAIGAVEGVRKIRTKKKKALKEKEWPSSMSSEKRRA